MNVPDFSGLTGKELVRAHRAWRNAETKKDAWADDIRFSGLTQTQAVEVHTAESRRLAAFMSVPAAMLLAFEAADLIFGIRARELVREAGMPEGIYIIARVADFAALALLGGFVAWQLWNVRNPKAARRSYIRAVDERLEDARKRSGLFPVAVMSLFEIYGGQMGIILASGPPPEPGLTLNSWAVGALAGAILIGLIQPLVAGAIYLALRRRS